MKTKSRGFGVAMTIAGLLLAGVALVVILFTARSPHSGAGAADRSEKSRDASPEAQGTANAPSPTPPATPTSAAPAAPASPGEPPPLHISGVDPENESQVYLRPRPRSQRMPRFLTAAQPGDPLEIALAHIRSTLPGRGFTAADLAQPRVKDRYRSEHNQVTHIVLRQQIAGIEVYNADISVNVTGDGSIINLHNHFIRNLADEINLTEPILSAEEAIGKAADHLATPVTRPLLPIENHAGAERAAVFSDGGISRDPIPAKLTYFASDHNETRLAWNLVVRMDDGGHWWDMNVDAASGTVLSKANWIAGATYNAFPVPLQSPDDGPRSLETGSEDPVASPFGWHDTDGIAGAEFTDTRGNNVEAQEDRDDNDAGGFRPDGGLGLVFDFPLDLGLEPVNYQPASIANLFFWNNLCHDIHYQYGFDEQSGNFQQNNYGNGGLNGDAVQADSQDGSGTNNANFGTPPDGTRPRMQMFEWTSTTPARDSALDNMIIVHEYGHGVSNRLTGGPANSSALTASQSRGMGEGWSDWWGLALTAKPSETGPTPRPVGTYVRGQNIATGAGIRPAPYSTNLGVNALTYGDLATGSLSVPHGIGTVWCTTIWEVYWELVDAYGFDPDLYTGTGGNNIAMQLIMDGLKLQPSTPTYLDARDAILMADVVNNGGANAAIIWEAFAKRGMGFSADDAGDPNSLAVTEAFDLPDDLRVTPDAGFFAAGKQGGPFTPPSRTYTLTNTGVAALTWSAAKSAAWSTLSQSGGTLAPGATAYLVVSLNPAANALSLGTYTDILSIDNVTSAFTYQYDINLRVEGAASMPFVEDFESGGLDVFWASTGTNEFRTQVTSNNGPNGGSFHLTMDDSVNGSFFSRNEVTLTIDLAFYENVVLTFWAREFGDESHGPPPTPFIGGADFDGVAISEDGVTWYEVQSLRGLSTSYTEFNVDLDAAIATHGLSYTGEFKIRFNQYDNFSIPTDGIAIDDIAITGTVQPMLLAVNVPAEATEGDGALFGQGTVSVSTTPGADLTVTLTSTDASEASAPATVLIPGGQNSATFDLTIIDDGDLDGTRSAVITASAAGHANGGDTIQVHDNESAILSLTIPATAAEGDGTLAGQGSVTASAAPATDVVVALSSNDPSEATVPASVTILAGQTSAVFDLFIVDDGEIDGPQNAGITAHVENWIDGSQSISVADNEVLALTVNMDAEAAEVDGFVAGIGSVSIDGTLTANLVVSIASDDLTELKPVAHATIQAGNTSGPIHGTVVNDALFDGRQTVNITATAAGFTPGGDSIDITDDEVDHFSITPIATTQSAGTPFAITVTAEDINNESIASYPGPANLSAIGDGGAVVFSPLITGDFSGGSWSGTFVVNTIDTNVQITASAGATTGVSNLFDVVVGPLDHFVWDPVTSPQQASVPFPVTITAVDAAGNTVNFNGTADLEAFGEVSAPAPPPGLEPEGETESEPEAAATIVASPIHHGDEYADSGDGPSDPVITYPPASGAPPPSCLIVNGDFETGDFTGWTVVDSGNGNFVINDGTLDPPGPDGPSAPCGGGFGAMTNVSGSGMHTLYQDVTLPGAVSSATLKWSDMIRNHAANFSDPNQEFRVEIRDPSDDSVLATVFSTDPGDPLLNDCVMRSADISAFIGQTIRVAFTEQDNLFYFNLHIDDVCIEATGTPVAMSPSVSGNFVNGVWTGNISIDEAATDVFIVATATGGSETGASNTFDVLTSVTLFDLWVAGYGLTGPDADPLSDGDGDGLTLSDEFPYNLDPTVAGQPIYDPAALVGPEGPVGLPRIELIGSGPTALLRITFIRRTAATNPGIDYLPRFSDFTLVGWAAGIPIVVTPIVAGWEEVIVEDTVNVGSATGGRRYGRVETHPAP